MLAFKVKQVANGYKLFISHASTSRQASAGDNTEYVFKSTEDFQLVEFIGQLICETKVKVERK